MNVSKVDALTRLQSGPSRKHVAVAIFMHFVQPCQRAIEVMRHKLSMLQNSIGFIHHFARVVEELLAILRKLVHQCLGHHHHLVSVFPCSPVGLHFPAAVNSMPRH